MIETMHNFAKSLEDPPGLIQVLADKDTNGGLIGISMWANEESFYSAMSNYLLASRIQKSSSSLRSLLESSTFARQFEEV
jgi:hypothetical protein